MSAWCHECLGRLSCRQRCRGRWRVGYTNICASEAGRQHIITRPLRFVLTVFRDTVFVSFKQKVGCFWQHTRKHENGNLNKNGNQSKATSATYNRNATDATCNCNAP